MHGYRSKTVLTDIGMLRKLLVEGEEGADCHQIAELDVAEVRVRVGG